MSSVSSSCKLVRSPPHFEHVHSTRLSQSLSVMPRAVCGVPMPHGRRPAGTMSGDSCSRYPIALRQQLEQCRSPEVQVAVVHPWLCQAERATLGRGLRSTTVADAGVADMANEDGEPFFFKPWCT
jgi:hypothetical protein